MICRYYLPARKWLFFIVGLPDGLIDAHDKKSCFVIK